MKKEDLRVIKTKKNIKESFVSLVEDKGYEHVCVSDITKRANVNRNTFYLHYANKEDLIRQVVKDIADNLFGKMKDFVARNNINIKTINEMTVRIGVREILLTLNRDRKMFALFFNDGLLINYSDIMVNEAERLLASVFSIQNYKDNVYYRFAFYGLYGTIKQYMIYEPYNMQQTSKLIAHLFYNSLINNI